MGYNLIHRNFCIIFLVVAQIPLNLTYVVRSNLSNYIGESDDKIEAKYYALNNFKPLNQKTLRNNLENHRFLYLVNNSARNTFPLSTGNFVREEGSNQYYSPKYRSRSFPLDINLPIKNIKRRNGQISNNDLNSEQTLKTQLVDQDFRNKYKKREEGSSSKYDEETVVQKKSTKRVKKSLNEVVKSVKKKYKKNTFKVKYKNPNNYEFSDSI